MNSQNSADDGIRPAPARLTLCLLVLCLLVPPAAPADAADPIDPDLLAGMEARALGPATMSGRVVALAGVPQRQGGDPRTLYVGSASGGLWRSTDGGATWEPLFDDQPVASIGAVTVDPTAPEVLWVGTGEPTPRNSASVGRGLYKSTDGGATWTLLGLEETERIARVVLDPRDTDTAYVCALGPTWAPGEERGVFKTTDGGASWEKVLYLDDTTGCAELRIDPENPNKLFAAMWQHQRRPWFFRSGGLASGLWVTRDGGETWTERTAEDGLPEPPLGRIGIAVAPSDPSRVYALVEAEENAFYASTDGGDTFRRVSTDDAIGNRPFYYSRIQVDPRDPTRIYSSWSLVSVSEDGGATWDVLVPFSEAHPDHHALWIDPSDPDFLVDGNDGGVAISRNRGETWEYVRNLPLAQYYHVRVDDETPYNVYGGLQDNGSWKGPSEVWVSGGIRNFHWAEVGFGDGFDTAPFPDDPSQGYSMSQEGYLMRWNLETGERRDVRPAPPSADPDAPAGKSALRFNWNAGFAQDPFDPGTIYFGSQFVHRSTDRGASWEVISPDLTTDRPDWQRQAESGGLTPDVTGAENFTTIVTIDPSPVERGVLWVGTDDGRLHVTRDGGESWSSVEGNLPGVPEHTWVAQVRTSPHDAATAFAVFDDHRRGNWETYLYRTTDFGATWRRLPTGRDAGGVEGYALSVVEDPVEPNLLFLGTELGLWVSLDAGESWHRWRHGVPTAVSVMDLAVQEREGDLVLGTHGRGVFVVDDLTPLRELAAGTAIDRPLHLFAAPPALQHEIGQGRSSRFAGATEFRGDNPAYGAVLSFYLEGEDLPHPDPDARRAEKRAERLARLEAEEWVAMEESTAAAVEAVEEEAAEEEPEEAGAEPEGETEKSKKEKPKAEIEVRDDTGEVIRTFEEPVTRGLNRVAWDLRRDAFERPPTEEESPWMRGAGPEVLPGTYEVTVRYGDAEAEGTVEVLPDPRIDVPRAEREAKWQAILAAGALRERLTDGIVRLHGAKADLARVQAKLREREEDDGDRAEEAAMKVEAAETAGPAPGEEDATAAAAEADGKEQDLTAAARDLAKRLDELERGLWVPEDVKGIPAEETPWNSVSYVLRSLQSSWDAPTDAQRAYLERAGAEVEKALSALDRLFSEDLPGFRARAEEEGFGLFAPPPAGDGPGAGPGNLDR